MAAIRIRELDHLVLRVADLERMLRFYCGVLGCTVERRRDELGLVQLRAGRWWHGMPGVTAPAPREAA